MTIPLVYARSTSDVTAAAPNADPPPGGGATHDADAASASHFGLALSMMLGHAAHELPITPEPTTTARADDAETEDDISAEERDLVPLTPEVHTGAIADDTSPQPAVHQSLIAAVASPLTIAPTPVAVSPDATAVADAHSLHRDRELLAADFRERLDRVIERLESEFGYRVEVAETYRSQTRQDALYAQGRSGPGSVVTWTRASNHTLGRAADLVIDGSYENVLAYERLGRIAREEGLRTLGPRDPGHVELPASPAASVHDSSEHLLLPNDVRAPMIARSAPSIGSPSSIGPSTRELEPAGAPAVARVAPVASVATIAQVARIAQVATFGALAAPAVHAAPRRSPVDTSSARGGVGRRTHHPTARTDATVVPTSVNHSGVTGDPAISTTPGNDARAASSAPNDERPSRARLAPAAARDGAAEVLAPARDELMQAVAGTDPTASKQSPTREAAPASRVGHTDMSERIARLLEAQDAANDRPLSQVLLRLERPDGGEDRLRVGLRGNTVSATLDVADQSTADRMSANVKELQRALARRGFDTDSITVRTVSRSVESATLSRAAGASVESDLQRTAGSSSSTSMNTSSRDRGARHDGERPSPDSQRQRSRREQKGER